MGLTLFLYTGTTLSFANSANIEPDFSFFDDPNISSGKVSNSKTEAEPPCITCKRELPKSKNHSDLEEVSRNIKKQVKSMKKSSETAECITCGRTKPDIESQPSGKKSKSPIWSKHHEVARYSESPQVAKMISWVRNHKVPSSRGLCYRYVKEALCGAKKPRCKPGSMVQSYPAGNPVFADRDSKVPRSSRVGVNAIKTLEKEGFKNLMTDPDYKKLIKNPSSAPKGALLIYTGGGNGGHIEIKTDDGTKGSYISDFSAPDSILQNELAGRASRRYQLVGVMIKPMRK